MKKLCLFFIFLLVSSSAFANISCFEGELTVNISTTKGSVSIYDINDKLVKEVKDLKIVDFIRGYTNTLTFLQLPKNNIVMTVTIELGEPIIAKTSLIKEGQLKSCMANFVIPKAVRGL